MRCSACGSEAAIGARFCAACGAALPVAQAQIQGGGGNGGGGSGVVGGGGGPVQVQVHVNLPHTAHAPARALTRRGHGGALAVTSPYFCHSCGQRTNPLPYFARGINIAKLALLFPFTSFVGPLVLFLIRKDRLVCGYCKALLSGEVHMPMLSAFSSTAVEDHALLGPMADQALMEKHLDNQEIAHLERSTRRRRTKAWTYGVLSAGLAGLGAVAVETGGPGPVFFVMGGLAGVGALVNGTRSKRDGVLAAARRQRQRVMEVLQLAREHGGKLTVTLVATHLQVDFREAEALLDGMVDGRRVDVHVDDQGRMTYVFPELQG
jgi:hypothetical protein